MQPVVKPNINELSYTIRSARIPKRVAHHIPMTFDERVIPILHDLASELLDEKLYGRLAIVSRYLDLFSAGQWSRLGSDERIMFIDKMGTDFHFRAWDDWELGKGSSYSRLSELLYHQKRSS